MFHVIFVCRNRSLRCCWSCSSFHFSRGNYFTEVGVCPSVAVLFFATYIYVYKNVYLPAMWDTWVRSLGWEDPLEKGRATHSSILAQRIPWTDGAMVSCTGLMGYNPWDCRVGHDWETFTFIFLNLVHFMCFLNVLDWHCTICPFAAFQSVMFVTHQCWYTYI